MRYHYPLYAVTVGLLLGVSGHAAASASDYAKLAPDTEYAKLLQDGEITPLGAERAGNADGTIPEWRCDDDGTPPHIDVAPSDVDTDTYPAMDNPFADEEPRFVITADNYQQYEDKLTPGTRKLFEEYPDAFRMPVYPTHRTACVSEFAYENTALNAKNGQLIDDGNGVADVFAGPPFPVPDNALQALWNTIITVNPWRENAYYTGIAIYAGGERQLQQTDYEIYSAYNDPAIGRDDYWARDKQLQSGFYQTTIKPERNRGTITIGREYLRKTANRRETWQYLPGTRRVRRFPYFGYDTPQGAGGLRGVDEDRLFNGAPNRFNWELGGTKEMLVPYNSYVVDSAPSYDALLGERVMNPDYTRWELHRVQVVIGTLKEGAQHWYQKRVLYLDEDTGHALLSDNYDHHGNLWRTGQQNYVWTPVLKNGHLARSAVYYDFEAGAYVAQRLINENSRSKNPKLNHKPLPDDRYTPSTARQRGFR